MALDIAKGLLFLHTKGVLHRDLKAENILIESSDYYNYKCKIADFGIARSSKGDEPKMNVGSLWWRAPEVQTYSYGKKADIFSLGMCFMEIIVRDDGSSVRASMYDGGKDVFGVDPQLMRNSYSLMIEKCPPEFFDIAATCCLVDPDERPSSDIVQSQLSNLFDIFQRHEIFTSGYLLKEGNIASDYLQIVENIWLDLTSGIFIPEFTQLKVPITQIVNELNNILMNTTSRGLPDNALEFFCSLLGIEEDNKLDLMEFEKLMDWFIKSLNTILNPIILPYWNNGLISGFINSKSTLKRLKSKPHDRAIIRFSNRVLGSLVIVFIQNNKLMNILAQVAGEQIIINRHGVVTSIKKGFELFPSVKYIYPSTKLEDFFLEESTESDDTNLYGYDACSSPEILRAHKELKQDLYLYHTLSAEELSLSLSMPSGGLRGSGRIASPRNKNMRT
eukprot:TRINITY_DN7054_c0_g1_i3.p1 TRINITY_DN7054_c0_g1~~TRINITY_DN7054_c0_g1_i3.p1  ORF type:complete len:447 (-),score=89.82 TRINITY_DN7054_c0_g1_i3:40-1380(-)